MLSYTFFPPPEKPLYLYLIYHKGKMVRGREKSCTGRIRRKEEFRTRGMLNTSVVRKTASCIVSLFTIIEAVSF